MAKQKLSPKARAAKKRRDLAFAKTFARKRKKAENQRLRRAAKKAGKNIKGKDYDQEVRKHKIEPWKQRTRYEERRITLLWKT